MLEKRKKVRKIRTILIALISIIMVLGIYINVQAIDLENDGKKINPIYKPEWEIAKDENGKQKVYINTTEKSLTVTVKGSAYETNDTQGIDDSVEINYASNVTSELKAEHITVFVDGVEVTDTTDPQIIEVSEGTETPNEESHKKDITHTIKLSNLEQAVRQTNPALPYKEWSGNISIKIAGRGQDYDTYTANVLKDDYGNQNMMETDQNGVNSDGTWLDIKISDNNVTENTENTMFADFIKPEFTYEYSNTTIVGGDTEKVTIVFDVTDKYFKETTLSNEDASQITVKVDDYDEEELNNYLDTNNHKQLKKTQHIYYDSTQGINYVNLNQNGEETGTGIGTKVGEKYQLVITGLDQGDAFKYSGYMSLGFAEGTITDKSDNKSSSTSITIGKDDVDGNPGQDVAGNGVVVDVVDPIWAVNNIDINKNQTNLQNSTVTMNLIATDKYYLNNVFGLAMESNTLEETLKSNILLYIDGQLDGDTNGDGVIGTGETPTVSKILEKVTDEEATNLETTGTGVKYRLTLSNWDAEKYSGTAKIVIPAGTIEDQSNTSNQQEFAIGHIDFIKPVITKVSSENIDTNSDGIDDAVEVVFKATDKFMIMDDLITIPDETNPTAPDEITVYVDNEEATGITRTLTSEEITETVDGVTVKGHKYTLILSNFEQTRTSINRDREFSDWSGTVRLDIKAGAIKDKQETLATGQTAGGNENDLTSIDGGFADFIKPNVTYEYSSTDIVRNHEDKTQRTFTMKFDVTDKYFESSAFAETLASKTTDAEKLVVLQEYLTIWIDGIDITNVETVTKKIVAIENVTSTMNKTVDGTITTGQTYIIGKSFTLEISGLEQETSTAMGNDYLNYSGVVTVAFNSGKALAEDTTGNTNVAGTITAPSITSGVNTPDGTGSGVVIDLVDPLWEQSASAQARPHDKYASLTIKGTDKYIATNNLQPSDIKVTVTSPNGILELDGIVSDDEKIYNTEDINGNGVLDDGEDINGNSTLETSANIQVRGDTNGNGIFDENEQGMMIIITEDTSVTLTYGKQYKVELYGYTSDAYQVKLTLRDGILVDESGNTSQETNFILFSSLAETSSETVETSEFLAQNKEADDVIPQRQYIEQVIFKDNLDGINDTRWDVSQLNDGTIWAWYTTRTADDGTTLYTVYIGSYIIINGNVNSSYLFGNIGSNENCKITGDSADNEMIENLHLLHVDGVTNMSHMFEGCGHANMQSLDLGSEFDTRLVTDMSYMFQNCGNTAMTTLDLGDDFDTSEVTNMSNMFNGCGQNELTTFSLGNNFNTAKVTNMSSMFQNFGAGKLESLDLGEKFDTSAVTDMSNMFNGCGKSEMITLTLGNNFNTAKVTNMSGMFQEFGQAKMEILDLGDKFYTTSATDMSNMFNGCGTTAMTVLDFGPAFTKIPTTNSGFVTNCGNSGTTIYASESIYSNMKNFKLNSTDTTNLINYTQGTINPVYKPEWEKYSSSLQIDNDNIENSTMTVIVNGIANKVGTPISQINYISDITASVDTDQITVYIDGKLDGDTNGNGVLDEGETSSIGKAVTVNTRAEDLVDGNITYKANGDIYLETNGESQRIGQQYKVILSNFEQSVRQSGKSFKEWSGNISLQFAKGTLKDKYGSSFDAEGNFSNIEGNHNLAVIDIDTSGTTKNIVVKQDETLTENTSETEAKMFTDFIKPEFTYTYSETDINYTNESVKVVFDVTDKYYQSTSVSVGEDTDGDGELDEGEDINGNGILDTDNITVKIDNYDETTVNDSISKQLAKTAILVMNKETGVVTAQATNYTVQSTERIIGERFELIITELDQEDANGIGDGFLYSGYMSLGFEPGVIIDKSGNESNGTTIAIGLNENDGNANEDTIHGTGEIVDVVDPVWVEGNTTKSTDSNGKTTAVIELIATDKYFDKVLATSTEELENQMIVEVLEGNIETVAPDLAKELQYVGYVKKLDDGTYQNVDTQEEANGVKYTLTISNIEESDTTFFAERAKYATDSSTGRVYREFSGPMSVTVPANTIQDKYGNTNQALTVDLGNVDALQPEIIKVSSQSNIDTENVENSTHTVVFDIVDKYLETYLAQEDTDKIHVYLDDQEVDITKTITNITDLTATINRVEGTVVGKRYTLVLSDFEKARTAIDDNRGDETTAYGEYTDWSGSLSIKIDSEVATDESGLKNAETILTGNENTTTRDFIDFIQPDVTYKYFGTTRDGVTSEEDESDNPDIDYTNKTFKMVFDITDKYFKESTLANQVQTIKNNTELTEEQKIAQIRTLINEYFTIVIDETDITENPNITITIDSIQDVTTSTAFNKTLTDGTIQSGTYTIGKRFTLLIKGLEQLEIADGAQTADYSGVITVVVKENTAIDNGPNGDGTNSNGNVSTAITSGVDIPGGTGTGQVVDVVDPIWEKTANAQANPAEGTATITILGTDKYYSSNTLDDLFAEGQTEVTKNATDIQSLMEVEVDGTVQTEGITIKIQQEEFTETYGVKFTITVSGFNPSAESVILTLKSGLLADQYQNTNKPTEFILLTTLMKTDGETTPESAFLGNEFGIQRQYVEKVTFLASTADSTGTDVKGVWDVSAKQDESIIAWYTERETNGTKLYQVYIGSDVIMHANANSSYLFANIGKDSNCVVTGDTTAVDDTSKQLIENIHLLHTDNVTDMSYMFMNFGYSTMKSLDLGDNFQTGNVGNMTSMFEGCGYTSMLSIDLGANFNTSNVKDNPDTTDVIEGSMANMFKDCGTTTMTNMYFGTTTGIESGVITLPDNFDTSLVTNMSGMFQNFGQAKITQLDLGNNFKTNEVTNMSGMFQNFAQAKMESLSLGDYFYTSAVTDMTNMFNGCGSTAMTSLDLGPAFANIPSTNTDFATNLGKNGEIKVYTGEGIYLDKNTFKLNTTDITNTISYTRGTIIPKYRPEWTRTSTTLDATGKTLTIVLEGQVNSNYSTNTIKTVTNVLTEGQVTANTITPINVRVDGVEANIITKTISDTTTGAETIQATITLSGFEEEVRQEDKNFLEWSGNIALQLARGTLVDSYGNANLAQTDETGTMQNIEIKNETIDQYFDRNVATGVMFTDFIKPEFTYEYYNTEVEGDTDANTVIDYVNNKITVVFDVTDKYFKQTSLATDTTGNLITVEVDEDEVNSTVNVTKTLAKKTLDTDKVVGNITYKANGDIYYTVNGTSKKIGERYELVIEGLETSNGVGYSGPMTLAFDSGVITDQSGNVNDAKTITIGIDEPTNPDHNHNSEVVVDFVNPTWKYVTSSITRSETDKVGTVTIELKATDKYFKETTLTTNDIHVFIDGVEQTGITKAFVTNDDGTTKIDEVTETDINGDEITGEKYTLLLSGFGNLSGETHIVIDEGTVEDQSGNTNIDTPIDVGNTTWTETGDDSSNPRYTAFRNNIVDFIKPIITYQYSTVEGSENPDIDYEEKIVTVKFTVSDKHLLGSNLIDTDVDGNSIVKNININVDGTDVTDKVTTRITADVLNSEEIEYTLAVSNLQQDPNNAFDFSGPMQLIFAQGAIDDTSGNKNVETTITLDTDNGDDSSGGVIVDVVDPIIYNNGGSEIDRINNTVTLMLRADDKYLTSEKLVELQNNVIVKVVKPNGEIVESTADSTKITKADGTLIEENTTTITRTITRTTKQDQYMIFKVVLSDFGSYEGVTSVIIPEDLILDTSGNGNIETEILVGNSNDGTAFKDSIVDFTKPAWKYEISSISRDKDENGVRIENGTVTLEIKGTDIYFEDTYFTNVANQLDLTKVKVYVDGVENTEITKAFATNDDGTIKKEYVTETAENRDILKGVKYTLVLGNFKTNEGKVKIEIPENAIKDTSNNGNILTPINVGNPAWVEDNEPLAETDDGYPKYTGFRNSIVDFIKPVIKYQYEENVNPLLNRTNETVDIIFTATDTNFLESNIGLEDIKVYIDNMQVYGTGANTTTAIQAELLTPVATDANDGLKYTLRLSSLELNGFIEDEIFERHSGVIKIVIAADQVEDSSGNKNNETTIIVDNDNGDNETNGIIVDFIKPVIYYDSQYINWNERYAEIILKGTDRFYDTTTKLQPSDITLYEQNASGQYVQITNFDGKVEITSVPNAYGYDFVIKLNDFEDEYKLKISIPAGHVTEDGTIVGLGDTSGNLNDATEIEVILDNKKPRWQYDSSTGLSDDGTISFNVKGVDKFLDLTESGLDVSDLKVIKDGVDITTTLLTANSEAIKVTHTGDGVITETAEKYKGYQIDISGITEVGTYSLVFAEKTLIDEFDNESAAKTITFSKSAIASNTDNYKMITYHVSPDNEMTHNSFVHELMSVNTTGTNSENTTFRPSTLGELHNNGENPLFAEPAGQSFAGWAEADEKGNPILTEDGTGYKNLYGLYDEISIVDSEGVEIEEIHLKAIWQNATVIYVSKDGDNNEDGLTPETAVQDIQTANSKLNTSGTAENNIIVIIDAVTWDSTETLTNNATITSLYAGIDYRVTKNAELKINSNMTTNADIIFDNIELYTDSTSTMLIANYNDVTLGRRITTSSGYTFGAVIGGTYESNPSTTGNLGTHTIRVEAGKYNNIIAGGTSTTSTIQASHVVVIGNMRDAAVSRNDKLTITGYLAIGQNEQKCYPSGATTTASAASKEYANVTLYSGTFTGENKFANSSEDAVIYLRTINGQADGQMKFEMYGGVVNKNIYGGSASTTYTSDNYNTMNFYGGQVIGNIFGQGANDTIAGGSTITLGGNFNITGNVFGGSNITTTVDSIGTGNSIINIDSSSVTVNGNIYGGGNAGTENATIGYIEGTTNITLNAGTVSNIYGSGYKGGNSGATNITINGGVVNQNIYGGAYENESRTTSNITVLGGTVKGNIYGGNENTDISNDTRSQNVNIIIGDTDATKAPTINGIIYGGGKYDVVNKVEIQLIECANLTTVYGGSDVSSEVATVNIYLKGMTVNAIYGGGQSAGLVGESNIYLESGTVTDVYGGGFGANVTNSNITLEGTAIATSIYGGTNTSGTVAISNVTLKSGQVTNVFGGGNSAAVGTANVTLDGINIGQIHGGSKDAGVTTTTNVILKSGTVEEVFGGGLDVGVTTANVKQQGATVTTIYGGNNSGTGSGGDTETTNINIENSTVENVYGGNKEKGTTRYANINIQGTSTITGKLYGGGYKSAIGKADETGSATINIAGGTINNDINGGSEQSIVYGNTNINVGYDATSGLTPANINILGTIYGAGDTLTDGTVTVVGDTHILMDNNTSYPIQYFTATGKEKSIYGSGNGGAIYSNGTSTDSSTIHLKDFGTSTSAYLFKSIEDTGDLYIGNSCIELTGSRDETIGHYFTLNTITNALTIYNNTTLYTQRGFNKVGGFNSYKNQTSTKQTVSISGTTVTTNDVDNRLYTLEGINLIFAKQEVELSNKTTIAKENWGQVNGMAFFGMYKINRTNGAKQYDIYESNFDYATGTSQGLFKAGTYVEAQHKTSHNIQNDGFYTNAVDETTSTVKPQVIQTTDYVNYYDWIIGAPTINYDVDLIASTYGKQSVAELLLDNEYASGSIYTLNTVSLNAVKPDVKLIDSLAIPTISSNSNNTFGLTMETDTSGWINSAKTNIYHAEDGSSFNGDTVYESDYENDDESNTTTPGKLKFKIYNSVNITEQRDLGNVNIILTGQQPISGSGTEAYTFKVVIAVNMQTLVDELKEAYEPSFTDRVDTELSYTTDSKIDLSYLLYKDMETTPYATGDYRVISTTEKLPAGTRITMKDYVQGKVYYYHVTGSETEVDGTRYLYRLSNFIEMGSTDSKYVDNRTYYNSTDGYVIEKYDISIDFIDSNINTAKLAQETYLELRSSDTTLKYDNGNTIIKYNLYNNKNAILTETISNEGSSYSVVEDLEIPITINASILEQDGIIDTKYHDQIAGIAIQIVDENGIRIKAPELQNFKLTNANDANEIYSADANGVIRMPIIEGFATLKNNYKLSITQANVPPGRYTAQVHFFSSDDGKYYSKIPAVEKEFSITFINKLLGLVAVDAESDSRIVNQSTGLNLQGNSGIDMTVSIGDPTSDTNVRVELYKRNSTYTVADDVATYTGTTYTLVDIAQYLQGTWEAPSKYGLTAENQYEYMVSPKQTYETAVELETIEFEKALVEGIDTGEYKLVFKAYNDDTLVQTVRKTFIVTP